MLEVLFDELASQQREKLAKFARQYFPNITADDLLQPNDFPLLENHPYFRYEEGVLEGILTARMAYLAWKRQENI
jgi:hypothetical protein